MINVDIILGQILKPLINDKTIGFYHYGNKYEFKRIFASQKYNTKYPIVWLTLPLSGQPKEDILSKRLECRVSLMLATASRKEWLNDKRNIETFEKVLNPLYDKILKTFQSNINIIIKENSVDANKLPNYFEDNQGTREKPPERLIDDYVDVILMEFDSIIKQPQQCK